VTDLPPRRRLPLPKPYTASADGHRAVRSFVLRQGRVSNAQARAVEDLLPRYGIPFRNAPLDLAAMFGAGRPVVLEIGFGMGETSAAIARARPDTGFLGVEVHTPGVGNLLQILAREGITNLRIVQHDAVEVLDAMIAPASLAGVHIFFPDPWPKKRHHKRRLIQLPLVERIASRLAVGGYLHLATDVDDYAGQMQDVAAASGWFAAFTAQESAAHPVRPATRFEHRGVRLGHQIHDLLFRKVYPPAD
jgi:tRNA (guanine-N7-)-methyltransferase